MWYMDLGGGWYDDEGIMAQVAALVKAAQEIRKKPYQSVAQIVVIVDEFSILCTHPSVVHYTEDLLRNLQLTGTPVDIIFSHDVENIDLSGTRLAVLLTPSKIDENLINLLKDKMSDKSHVLYCGKTNAEVGVGYLDVPGQDYPLYTIQMTEGCRIISQNKYGVIAAENAQGDFILGDLAADVELLRNIVEGAGVHCYAPSECAVYADNRIVSFFPRKDMSFIPSMPEGMCIKELLTGIGYSFEKPLCISAKSGMAFCVEKQ